MRIDSDKAAQKESAKAEKKKNKAEKKAAREKKKEEKEEEDKQKQAEKEKKEDQKRKKNKLKKFCKNQCKDLGLDVKDKNDKYGRDCQKKCRNSNGAHFEEFQCRPELEKLKFFKVILKILFCSKVNDSHFLGFWKILTDCSVVLENFTKP